MDTLTFEQLPTAFTYLFQKVENIERLLQRQQEIPEQDQLLTIQQVAELLKLSVPTVYGLVSRSVIPVNKKGKRLYFSKSEITDWIKSGRKKTLSEINNEANSFIAKRRSVR